MKTVVSAPHVIADLLPAFVPYSLVLAGFAGFVVWNGGIVLGKKTQGRLETLNADRLSGDKSNHVPVFHVPQFYYFIGFCSLFGWPALVTGKGGLRTLFRDIWGRMFGNKRYLDEKQGFSMDTERAFFSFL